MEHITQLIEIYGIYAVFFLCAIEGDITLMLSGVMAHSGFFGQYSFLKVFLAGTSGGIFGDIMGYSVGRFFNHTVKNYRFYKATQPRIKKLTDKFGGSALILSKYVYGIRVAMCISLGACRMPFHKFLLLDSISCSLWVLILAGCGYFFSGAITNIIGDFHQIGAALFVILIIGIIAFYITERFWLGRKVEEAQPELIHKIEEKIHVVEEVAQEKLHNLSERLHLTADGRLQKEDKEEESTGKKKAAIKK
jgi:membrane protein DedA with SNARE-associated domain